MGKRTRRLTADEEDWDPTSRPKTTRKPTVRDPSDSDSSQTTSKSSSTAAPRKGGRTRVACDQCSKRRSRCDLQGPSCQGCVERGDSESCSYQALIWIENVEDLPSRQLRRKLDAFESLIRALPKPITTPSPPKRSPLSLPVQLPPASPPPEFANNSVSSSLSSCRDSLARALFFNCGLGSLHLPEGVNTANLDFELRRLDNNFLLSTARMPPSVPPTLPSPQHAHLAICFFSSTINPTFRLVYEPIFFRECQDFWASGMVPSPSWLALYLAICAAGLKVVLGDKDALSQAGISEDDIAHLADKCWTEARETLEGEGFPLASSLESIQVALLLSLSVLYGDSSNIARASTLISLAACAAADLGLDVDPREGPATATPLEVEMQRRTFWALYTCEAMSDLIAGKEPSAACSANPLVRRPLFLSNECYLPASGNLSPVGVEATTRPLAISPTSSLLTVATLSIKISRLVKSGRVDREIETVRLLEEMESYDGAFRSSQVAESMFRAAYLRLHQAARELNLSTRDRDSAASRYLDALLRSAVSPGPTSSPDMLFFSNTLAYSAALRSCLTLYDGQITFERNRPDLANFASALGSSYRPTSLRLPTSRCTAILSHILETRRRTSLEATPSLIGSSLTTPNSETTLPSPAGSGPVSAVEPPRYTIPNPVLPQNVYEGAASAFLPYLFTDTIPTQSDEGDLGSSASPAASRPLARPLLSLRTAINPGGPKPATPVMSPWQDCSQTPSRYIGYSWGSNLFSLPE